MVPQLFFYQFALIALVWRFFLLLYAWPSDRLLWVWLSRLWPGWQEVLEFVQPRTGVMNSWDS
jgi:hypothetical protein